MCVCDYFPFALEGTTEKKKTYPEFSREES